MKDKILFILFIGLFIFVGCKMFLAFTDYNKLESGIVIKKIYEPERTYWTHIHPNGAMPILHVDDEYFIFEIKGYIKNKERIERHYVLKDVFNKIKIGDMYESR